MQLDDIVKSMLCVFDLAKESGDFAVVINDDMPYGVRKIEIEGNCVNVRFGIVDLKELNTNPDYLPSWIYMDDEDFIKTVPVKDGELDGLKVFVEGYNKKDTIVQCRLTFDTDVIQKYYSDQYYSELIEDES